MTLDELIAQLKDKDRTEIQISVSELRNFLEELRSSRKLIKQLSDYIVQHVDRE